MKKQFLIFLCCVCVPLGALMEATAVTPYPKPENGTEIVVTFGGDSTLGSEDQMWHEATSFIQTIKREGFSYPFEKLYPLFSKDDLTIVNLEGTFYEGVQGKRVKTYNFRAPLDYAKILPLGSIEAVTLGNNHAGDYGQPGFDSTIQALEKEQVDWFVEAAEGNKTFIYEKNGIKIGFVGFYIGYWRSNIMQVRAALQSLQEAGCATIVGIMHGGTEYAEKHGSVQDRMADTILEYGASLVIGHHPHVVHGMDVRKNASILYSLGNLSFGGNKRIKKMADTALVVQARFVFDRNKVFLGHQLTIHPIHPSGTGTNTNDYRPILAKGAEAERVMGLMQMDTAFPLAPYVEGKGALQVFVPAPPRLPGPPGPLDIHIKIEDM